MSTPKWEVVSKANQKKSKIPQHVGQKSKKKFDPNSMPRIEPADPVKESPTIYDAFIEKQPNHVQPSKVPVKHPVETNGGNSSPKRNISNKKKTVDKKPVKISLEDAIHVITYDNVESLVVRDQATFPDNPPLWVMDMASMINHDLEMVEENDPVLEGKSKDYPLSVLPNDVKKLARDTMLQCSKVKLSQCFSQMVTDMVNDLGKGKPVHGYRMFIQLACQLDPTVVSEHFPQFQELIKMNQNRHLRCLAVMWAVGQVGYDNLTAGLKVWFEMMLPLLNVRNMASYIIDYAESLFDVQNNKSSEDCVAEKHFFNLFDLMHNLQQLSLPGQLQKKLHTVYEKVKALSLRGGPHGMSKVIFPSFLKRCNDGINDSLRKEIVECLVLCLKEDKLNFSHWRHVYTKYLPQSGILLHHLDNNWRTVGSSLDKKLLKETIKAFTLTNEDLLKKGKNDIDCDLACKELTIKLNARRFSFSWFFVVLITAVVGLFVCDVYVHQSFQKSRTRKFLHDSGMLPYLEQAWNRMEYYTAIVLAWLFENVPHYYGKMCEVVAPYLSLFWEKLFVFGEYVVEVTEPTRLWLGEKIPLLLEWIDSKLPWLWENLSHYLSLVLAVIVKYGTIIWSFLTYYTFHAGVWLQENIFNGKWSLENLQESMVSGLHSLWLVIQYSAHKVGALIRNTTDGLW